MVQTLQQTTEISQLQYTAGIAGTLHFARCVPCCRSQAPMPCIMAGMDQRYSCVSAWMVSSCLGEVVHTPVVCNDICLWSDHRKLWRLRSCSTFERGRRYFLSWRRGRFPWSFTT